MTTSTTVHSLPTGPAHDGNDAPFWEGLARGVLVLPRCAECRVWREPGRILCGECHSFATSWEQVRPRGTVFTWIRSHRSFIAELDVAAPYVTVLVQLEDAPVRLLGILEEPEAVAIGTEVTGVIRTPAQAEWPILRWAAS